jgi:hypothetical protein
MTILPVGAGVGAIFHPRVRPALVPRIDGCRREFYFSPVDDLHLHHGLVIVFTLRETDERSPLLHNSTTAYRERPRTFHSS